MEYIFLFTLELNLNLSLISTVTFRNFYYAVFLDDNL